jgi:lipoprotein NlpD
MWENSKMVVKQWARTGRLCAALVVPLVIVGCANTRPAPVVNRTNMPQPAPEAPPPLATVPSQPLPPGGPLPSTAQPADGAVTGAETSPIRSGNIESGSIQSGAAPIDPNLKTGPKGLKRPYGEVASVDPGVASQRPGAASSQVSPAAVVPATAPASIATAPVTPPPPQPVSPVPAPAAGGTGLLDGVAFAWPATGTVLQNFDETSSKGLSLGGKAGDSVRAAADGRVIFSGAGPRGYGNLVIVKHSAELLSVYAHNRSLSVKEGENVKRGQKIAELGNSGTDKPKLHFEIRQQGKPIDPLAVLPRR